MNIDFVVRSSKQQLRRNIDLLLLLDMMSFPPALSIFALGCCIDVFFLILVEETVMFMVQFIVVVIVVVLVFLRRRQRS